MAELGVEEGGCVCLDLGPYLLGGGSVGHTLQVGDVGHGTAHWECFGRIPPQNGPQAEREATSEKTGWSMGLLPTGGRYGRGRIAGSGGLHLLPPEHSLIVYCNQAHYGSVSGSGVEARIKSGQAVVGA